MVLIKERQVYLVGGPLNSVKWDVVILELDLLFLAASNNSCATSGLGTCRPNKATIRNENLCTTKDFPRSGNSFNLEDSVRFGKERIMAFLVKPIFPDTP